MKIRRLTDIGIEQFRCYLDDLRKGSTTGPPYDLLIDPQFSTEIKKEINVERRVFNTRLDLARYLDRALSVIANHSIESDIHLWSWLSLFFFDQVCPADRVGVRMPGRDYRHILEPGYRNGHRHLLTGAYLIYSSYCLGDRLGKLLLGTPPHVESKFYHQLAARQILITNKSVLEAAWQLYFNQSEGRPKKGASEEKNSLGTLRRFIAVIQQLDLTYDLYSMSGDQILALLPHEFNQWKNQQPSAGLEV
jgi:hypothetical protein